MNRYWSLTIALVVLMIFSCRRWHKAESKAERPVTVELVKREKQRTFYYTGGVEAVVYADLAFPLSGVLITLPVELGQQISKGSLVAKLDPLDFQSDYDSKQAAYLTAKSQWERDARLLKMQAVSQQDYELSKAQYIQAQSNYGISAFRLKNTELRAPFDGVITKKYVENYQQVKIGESVVRLMDPKRIEVIFLLPETEVRLLEKRWKVAVEFDQLPKHWFAATIKEVVNASLDGSGIPVRLAVVDSVLYKEKHPIMPGLSCRIRVEIEDEDRQTFLIPLSALLKDLKKGDLWVWQYDTLSSRVVRRLVEVDGLTGQAEVRVVSGVQPNYRIVVSGGNFLTEGEKVKVITNK